MGRRESAAAFRWRLRLARWIVIEKKENITTKRTKTTKEKIFPGFVNRC